MLNGFDFKVIVVSQNKLLERDLKVSDDGILMCNY
jgi:hypothetical protein